MPIRYSYPNFTTKSHGVIEYTDPGSSEDGKKRKRRSKIKPKFATRWPSAAPMKLKATKKKADASKSIQKETLAKRGLTSFACMLLTLLGCSLFV